MNCIPHLLLSLADPLSEGAVVSVQLRQLLVRPLQGGSGLVQLAPQLLLNLGELGLPPAALLLLPFLPL